MARTRRWALVSIVFVAACSSDRMPGSDASVTVTMAPTPRDGAGPPKKTGGQLFAFANEPAGTNCASGGQVLMSGTDLNNNDSLDPDEVATRSYICNGTDGKTPVLSQKPEPIGTACPTGGQAIAWGYDDNKSGVLDASEVKQTSYVCNGLDGANGTNGKNGLTSLVTVLPEDPGVRCATGGQGIYSGLDLDGDGLLQPAEVKNTSFVCNGIAGATGANGASGMNALVSTEVEPAGVNCTNGGLEVLSGTDGDGDGVLDAGEVSSTSYACHGAPGVNGAAGAAGISSAITVTTELPGANCATGGQRIDVGSDANANGMLDPSEVAQTRYVCNGSAAGGTSVVTRETALEVGSVECPLRGE